MQVVAGDSATFALTTEGTVFGWGTFRDNQGILGFTSKDEVQTTPIAIKDLDQITSIASGNNFMIALGVDGAIYTWGAGQQNQLGRDVAEEDRYDALRPYQLDLDDQIAAVFAGQIIALPSRRLVKSTLGA